MPGATPAIVDQDTFALAQERMGRNKELARRNRRWHYLLSGHLRCRLCGRSYVGKTRKQGNYIYHYYTCAGKDKVLNLRPCPGRHLNGQEADSQVWDEIERVLRHPESL